MKSLSLFLIENLNKYRLADYKGTILLDVEAMDNLFKARKYEDFIKTMVDDEIADVEYFEKLFELVQDIKKIRGIKFGKIKLKKLCIDPLETDVDITDYNYVILKKAGIGEPNKDYVHFSDGAEIYTIWGDKGLKDHELIKDFESLLDNSEITTYVNQAVSPEVWDEIMDALG